MSMPNKEIYTVKEGDSVELFIYPSEPDSESVKVSSEDDKVRVEHGSDSFTGQKSTSEFTHCLVYDDEADEYSIQPISSQYALTQLQDVDDFLDKELLDGFQDISDDDVVDNNQPNDTAAAANPTQPMSLNAFLGNDSE